MNSITVHDVAELWLRESLKSNVKSSTMTTYYNYYNRVVKPQLGKMDITLVDGETVASFFEKLNEQGVGTRSGKLSSTAINVVHNICYSIFEFAKERGYIKDNPYTQESIDKPSRKTTEKRVLTRVEQYKLERTCRYYLDYRVIGILLALYTGMRIGEVCSLQWEDVDFKRHVISVNKTVSRVTNFDNEDEDDSKTVMQIRTPKTQCSCRIIPLPKFLMDKLLMLKQVNPYKYVVNNKNDNPMCPRMLTYIFKRVVKLAGIKEANFHCLRHTFATRALESGMDIKTVSEVLGHSNHAITLNVYVHSLLDHKRAMMGKVQPLINDSEMPFKGCITEEDIYKRM